MTKAVFSSRRCDVLLGLVAGPNHSGVEALYPRLTREGHTVLSPQQPEIEQVRRLCMATAQTTR